MGQELPREWPGQSGRGQRGGGTANSLALPVQPPQSTSCCHNSSPPTSKPVLAHMTDGTCVPHTLSVPKNTAPDTPHASCNPRTLEPEVRVLRASSPGALCSGKARTECLPVWWCTPLLQAPRRQRQTVLSKVPGQLELHWETSSLYGRVLTNAELEVHSTCLC